MLSIALFTYIFFLISLSLISVRGGQRTDRGGDFYHDVNSLSSLVPAGVSFQGQSPEKTPFVGTFGANISNIYSIDLASSSFSAEGTAWLKYRAEDRPQWLKEWDPQIYKSPARMIQFVNATDRTNFDYSIIPSRPHEDSDGRFIQWVAFSGRFVSPDLDLRMFPFETIDLSVEIDLDDVYATEAVVGHEKSGPILTTSARISGYNYLDSSVTPKIHSYSTNWGYAYSVDHFKRQNYTLFLSFLIKSAFARNPWNSFLNIFLPLMIVMVVVLSSPLIAIQDYETRLAIPASALLVLVFLQEGYKSILPKGLNYPTLADLIYIFNMLLTIVVFVWSLFQTKSYFLAVSFDGFSPSSFALLDYQFFVLTLLFFVVAPVTFFLVYSRRFGKDILS